VLEKKLSRFVSLSELEVLSVERTDGELLVRCRVKSKGCLCRRCAVWSEVGYDSRVVEVRDEPLRKANVRLRIQKRRFYCKTCRKPFMETVGGIWPRQRTTQRFRRTLLWACEHFRSLKSVREVYRCSNSLIYKTVFEHLELKLRQYQYPWPEVIGIDEHFFRRSRGYTEFFTVFTDMKRRRLREAVLGRSVKDVLSRVEHIEGRRSVKWYIIEPPRQAGWRFLKSRGV
jgi:transposase